VSNAVIDGTPFDHHASGALGALPDGQCKVYKSDRKRDLVFPTDVVGQDAGGERSGVLVDTFKLI